MRPVLQTANLMLRLGKKDFLPIDLNKKEHRFGADHLFFQNVDHLLSRRAVEARADEAAQKPKRADHEKDQGNQRQKHLDEGNAIVSWREIGDRKILRERLAISVRGVDNFAKKMKEHAVSIAFKEDILPHE